MGKYVGIDLGTTFCAVCYIDDSGSPKIIENREGEALTSSTVFFEDGNPLVGSEAKSQSFLDPDHYVAFAKRDMGSRKKNYSIDGEKYSPEEISAIILKKLKDDTEKALGEDILGAVITVPAYFTDSQRKATRDAATMANIPVLSIINEPTAAALSYGIEKGEDEEKTILVYDLGGGTFDVSIMRVGHNNIEILSSCGDHQLGGYDFDNKIIDWFRKECREQGINLDADPNALQNVSLEAEKAKKALSGGRSKVRIAASVLGKSVKAELSKEEFEEMIDPFIFQSISIMNSAIEEANIEYSDLDKILLVGGSTRIPLVRAMIKEETGMEPSSEVHADEAVAIGAAYHAVEYVKRSSEVTHKDTEESKDEADVKPCIDHASIPNLDVDYTFTDRTSHGIGVEVIDTNTNKLFNSVILPKNSILPAKAEQDYGTEADYQEAIKLTIREGESEQLKYTSVIGETILKLRPKPKGSPIRVSISCDTDALVHVHVFDLTDQESLGEMEIKRKNNMTKEEVAEGKEKVGKLNIGWED